MVIMKNLKSPENFLQNINKSTIVILGRNDPTYACKYLDLQFSFSERN